MKSDILIIDGTKDPAPFYVRHEVPTFRTEYEKQKFWAEEKRRRMEGYYDLTGDHYNYVQWQHIKNRITGELIYPDCRDVDLEIFQIKEDCIRNGENMFVEKGRGAGLTSIMGGMINSAMINNPGSTCIGTSKDTVSLSRFFSEAILPVYDNYHPAIKPTEVNRNNTKQNSYLKVSVAYLNEGRESYGESTVMLRETTEKPKSANAFSGMGAILGCYDELPLIGRWKELLKSSEYCFFDKRTGSKTGFLLAGGTAEESLTNEQILDFMRFAEESKLWNFRKVFIPFWKGMYMVNGHSDEAKAMEWWNREYEKRLSSGDDSLARAFRLNNPRSEDDIYDLASANRFKESTMELIKQRSITLNKNEFPRQPAMIVIHPTQGATIAPLAYKTAVTAEKEKDYISYIYEHPKKNIKYFCCVDGTGTGTVTGNDDGSSFGILIMKEFDAGDFDEDVVASWQPVYVYYHRPKSVADGVEAIINACQYYDIFGGFQKIWAEGNSGLADYLSTALINRNLMRYIGYRIDVSRKGNTNTRKYFQVRTEATIEFQHRMAENFIDKHIHQFVCPILLKQMMQPKEDNTDVLDAWFQMFIGYQKIDVVMEKKEPPKLQRPIYYVDGQGVMRVKYESEYVLDPNDPNPANRPWKQ